MATATLQFPSFLTPKIQRPARPQTTTTAKSLHSFLDLAPESKPETLSLSLPLHDRSSSDYDAAIIGCGPSGLRLADLASSRGLRVCCIDPNPLLSWSNNYGTWVDEFDSIGLSSCLDVTWPITTVQISDHTSKHLHRPYGRISRSKLKRRLIEGAAGNGVRFHKAKAWTVDHDEFRSTISCSDGSNIKASLVVDASGFASPFTVCDKPRDHGYQIAHGILAEVDSHPFDLDKMVLMDWRDSHLDNEPYLRIRNEKTPTFLYAMPLDSNLIFLEETSLVSRPMLSYSEIKKRMVARLRYLGIRVRRVIEDEKCVIPMGGPLPKIPQSVMGIGGAAGLVHPSTGFMVSRALAVAPAVADAMAECLGSTRMIRGRPLYGRVWGSLWTEERKRSREFYRFGMETLLKLDLEGTRGFFDAFFELDEYYWAGFLSSRLAIGELAGLSLALFGRASGASRVDIVTKCPLPLVRMMSNLALQAV